MRINQNIMAFNAYRNVDQTGTTLGKSLEKLSSGFRINRAADDAAGLVISQGLRSQVSGLRQATRNAQDGVSVVQIAEGALQEVHTMLNRIRDLAVQASNTGSNDTDARTAANNEVAQLTAEITRNVGRKKTLEMMLTGRKMPASEALACGLLNQVVPAAELEATTMKLANEIAERSPATMRLGLNAFYRSQDMELEPQLKYLQTELGRVFALEDAREGMAAFMGKRKPVWKGK